MHLNSWSYTWQDKLSCERCFLNRINYFHDLQTNLQTKFSLLKKATLKNIENLQEASNFQQTYTTTLCIHINSIYAKLVQLNGQVQMHCLYPHPQSDVVQINVPEYDLDRWTDQPITRYTTIHAHCQHCRRGNEC